MSSSLGSSPSRSLISRSLILLLPNDLPLTSSHCSPVMRSHSAGLVNPRRSSLGDESVSGSIRTDGLKSQK